MDSIYKKDVSIPSIGLGTYKLTGNEGMLSIQNALEIGYRHIDTAKMYENESEVGRAIRNSHIDRENIFVTTKIWPTDFKQLVQKTEDSLRQLKTDYVDLLLLHWPADEEMNKIGAELLNEVLHKGYTKLIGVSNFNTEQMQKVLTAAPIVSNQVEYHPYLSQQKVLDFLHQNNMMLTAYRPLALGKVIEDPILKSIAAIHGKTVGQIVLRWLIQQKDVAVIPKSGSSKRQEENLNIFDFELNGSQMKMIFDLKKNERLTNPATAPEWD